MGISGLDAGFGLHHIPSSIENRCAVVPTPFPYSLCKERDKHAVWLTTIGHTRLLVLRVRGGILTNVRYSRGVDVFIGKTYLSWFDMG